MNLGWQCKRCKGWLNGNSPHFDGMCEPCYEFEQAMVPLPAPPLVNPLAGLTPDQRAEIEASARALVERQIMDTTGLPPKEKPAPEEVNHPSHYNRGIETIDYIESHKLDFNEGNVVKYVTRWRMKGGEKDLQKARFYLDRLIDEARK